MNQTLSLLFSHHSDRSFTDEPVSEEALCSILEAARRAPTTSNAQHVSVVVVRDAARRARIAEFAGNQAWIAKAPVFLTIVIDVYKTGVAVAAAGGKLVYPETVESLLAGVTDAGIALATMLTAARSLGLGIVPIGGIRRNPQAIIDFLELPPNSFPLVGMCVGHVDQPAKQKPRLPMKVFRHDERYHREGMAEAIAAYDAVFLQYGKDAGQANAKTWSKGTVEAYQYADGRPVKSVLQKQGFTLER